MSRGCCGRWHLLLLDWVFAPWYRTPNFYAWPGKRTIELTPYSAAVLQFQVHRLLESALPTHIHAIDNARGGAGLLVALPSFRLAAEGAAKALGLKAWFCCRWHFDVVSLKPFGCVRSFLASRQGPRWLAQEDPSLFCVSAWNDNGRWLSVASSCWLPELGTGSHPHQKLAREAFPASSPTKSGSSVPHSCTAVLLCFATSPSVSQPAGTDYFPGLGWMIQNTTWSLLKEERVGQENVC